MNPSDVFNSRMYADHGNIGGSRMTTFDNYWEIELDIANTADVGYSYLEDCQDEKQLRCGLCGTVANTNSRGDINPCKHQICVMARTYWTFTGFKEPLPQVGCKNQHRTRSQWFRKTLMEQRGVGQIYKIPLEQRLDTVLALQLIRNAIESREATAECAAVADCELQS